MLPLDQDAEWSNGTWEHTFIWGEASGESKCVLLQFIFLFLHIFLREISGNRSLNIQIIGEGIDGIKKERQAVRSKIKVLEDELKLVDAEIASLQEDLDAATARKDKAYESLQELRAVRDAKVSLTYF